MASAEAKSIEKQFREMRSEAEVPFDLEQERANVREAYELTGEPGGVTYERDEMAGTPVVRAIPEEARHLFSVVFLHGGAFCLMSAWTHHRLAGHIAKACRAQVVSPDYALAPEKPFPAALDDCASAFGGALEEQPEGLVALLGDSAGGGLALSLLLRMRAEGRKPPFAAVLMAPWLDLTLSSPSVKAAADADVILTERNLREMARLYLAGSAADNPMASPLFGEFSGLPPLYVQASGRDLLRDDSIRLRDAYAEQNLDLKLELFPEMLHSFQFFAGKMPEAGEAILKSAAFLEEKHAVLRHRDKTTG